MKPNPVTVHVIAPAGGNPQTDIKCLSESERVRATRFRFKKDAIYWISCRAILRTILGNTLNLPPHHVPIVLTEFGKPVLADDCGNLHFNLSHCDDMLLIATSRNGPVGIDVEPSDRAAELVDCIESFCHPEEIRSLPNSPAALQIRLLEIWTAKEALLKALGTGFSHAPEHLQIHFGKIRHTGSSTQVQNDLKHLDIRRLRHPGLANHCAHLAAPKSCANVEIITQIHAKSPRSGHPAEI